MADGAAVSGRFIHPQSLAANKPISEQETDNNRDNKNNNVRRIHFPLHYRGIVLTPAPAAPAAAPAPADDDSIDPAVESSDKPAVEEKQQEPQEEYVPPVYTKINHDTIAHINNGSLHHQHTIQHTAHTTEYPKAYKTNTPYELQVLEYINDYRLQYITLFSQRKPLLYTCQNECNITKCINTYIKPVLLPYTTVCDLQSAAQLVADIITYQQLTLPCELPVSLNTSSTVIQQQRGNSLEMSILLASILIGMNYNVYVVSGYASHAVCSNNQSNTQCADLIQHTTAQPVQPIDFGSYTKLIQPSFHSRFEHNQRVRTQMNTIQLQNAADQAEREQLLAERKVHDPHQHERIHFWLLVLPDSTHSKSDVSEPMFIETSTGSVFSIADATQYVGIESLFNHTSYYINMQHKLPCTALSYELHDIQHWDCMLGRSSVRGNARTESVSSITITSSSSSQLQHNVHSNQWIQPIVISKKLYEYRYLLGTKHTKYYCCDCYHYNKYSQPDSAIVRYIVYATDRLGFETSTVKYVKTRYYNRKDKLIESVDNNQDSTKLYTFDAGLTSGLHTYQSTPQQETYIFYDNTRIDRLAKRICIKLSNKQKRSSSSTTITEYYNARADRLQQRTLTVTSDTTQHQLHTIQLNYSNLYSITILSIDEIYKRNIAVVDPALDIASVTYNLINDTIDIKSHHINTQLHSTIAQKTLQAKTVQLKNLKHSIKEHELSVYDIQTTVESIVATPPDTAVPVVKTMNETIDDMLASGVQNNSDSAEQNTLAQIDYLKSFIDKYVPANQTQPWTNNQKQLIRESALSVYKQTLLDRSNIINDHIDALKQQLQSVTQQYKRNVNNTANQAEINELQFQLQVLQDRKVQYEQAVLKKYIAFDQKLSADQRLQMT